MGVSQKAKKFTILTYNTLGTPLFAPDITKRYRKIAQLINNKKEVDIVCLYEIFTYYHFYLFKKGLNRFDYAYYKKNTFGPRGGIVIFSKIPLTEPKFIDYVYPEGVYVPFYNKIAHHGILTAKVDGLPFRILTSHLSSDTTHTLTPKNKLYKLISIQSQQAAEIFTKFVNEDVSVVFPTDLNIAKHSLLYEDFMKKTKAVDVFATDETFSYFPDRIRYFYRSPASRCDFIFVKSPHKEIKILKTEKVFIEKGKLANNQKSFLSDHIGLQCSLEVNRY